MVRALRERQSFPLPFFLRENTLQKVESGREKLYNYEIYSYRMHINKIDSFIVLLCPVGVTTTVKS